MSEQFSVELQLVLALSHPDGLQTDALEELLTRKDINWQRLIDISHKQHLSGVIYQRIKKDTHKLPTQVIDAFAAYASKTAGRNLFLLQALEEITRAFAQAQVELVQFKGIDYLQRIYLNLDERFLSDLDLLVQATQLEKARTILSNLGYHCIENVRQSRFHEKRYGYIHAPLQCVKGGINIDLHIRLGVENAKINALAWQHLENKPYTHFENTFTLLYHCYHLNKHVIGHGFKLNQLTELVLLWNQCTDDQKTEVLDLAQRADGEAWLNNSFDLLSYFYPSEVRYLETEEQPAIRQNMKSWIEDGIITNITPPIHSLNILEWIAYGFFQIFPTKNYLKQWHGTSSKTLSYAKLWRMRFQKLINRYVLKGK
jgi:hypothetical protein